LGESKRIENRASVCNVLGEKRTKSTAKGSSPSPRALFGMRSVVTRSSGSWGGAGVSKVGEANPRRRRHKSRHVHTGGGIQKGMWGRLKWGGIGGIWLEVNRGRGRPLFKNGREAELA